MSEVRFIIMGQVKDGDEDRFRDLASRMTDYVRDEEAGGTIVYKWFLSDDGGTINQDAYSSSEAFGAHLANAQESGLLDEFMGALDIKGVHVLGDVDDAAREMLAAFGAVHYSKVEEL